MGGVILAIDDGTAAVVVAAIGLVGGVLATLLGRVQRGVSAINKAVNNVPEGTPTLVHRVDDLERRHLGHERWMTDCMIAVGSQLGVHLPDRRHYQDDKPQS
jgi:hypothetical protein